MSTEAPSSDDRIPAVERLRRDVSIGDGAREGAKWLAPARMVAQGSQFVAGLVTARILLPEQFGQAAVVLAIGVFVLLFTDLGLGAAVVQAKQLTEELLSTAFWLNLISGVVLTLLGIAIAFPLGAFYDLPHFVPLMIITSVMFTVACGLVQTAVLERTFNFKKLAIIEASCALAGNVSMPIMALAGLGTFSLVLGPLLQITLTTAVLWTVVRWVPKSPPDRASLAALWRFSRGLVGFNVLVYWTRNLDTLALGKVASAGQLGEYTRSYNLTLVPVTQMSTVVSRVLYPSLARLQDDAGRLGRAWIRGMTAAGALTLPVSVSLAACAPATVAVLLGPRWAGMVPELTLLAISTVPQIVTSCTGVVYRAAGRTAVLLKWAVLGTLLTLSSILVGLHWGTVGVAAALAIRWWLALPITLMPLSRVTGLPTLDFLRPVFAMALPAAGLAVGQLVVRFAVPDDLTPFLVLPAQLAAGAVGYLLVLWRTQPELLQAVAARLRRLHASRRPETAA